MHASIADADAVAATRAWLEHAVIGLNLCPFAKAVHVKGLVHYAVSAAQDTEGVLEDLAAQADELAACDPAVRETTLLIVPACLHDFLAFNALLPRAERSLRKRGYEGVLQLASFHPDYEFAGSAADDVANSTNRSPYPLLHLLREASIDRAVESFAQPEAIYEANVATMQRLGKQGWDELSRAWNP